MSGAGLEHPPVRRGRSSRHEPDPGPRRQQRRRVAVLVPEHGVGGPEDAPAAGRGPRVDPAPRARQAHGPGRHPGAGRVQAGDGELLGQPAQVGEARGEPAELGDVLDPRCAVRPPSSTSTPSARRRRRGRARRSGPASSTSSPAGGARRGRPARQRAGQRRRRRRPRRRARTRRPGRPPRRPTDASRAHVASERAAPASSTSTRSAWWPTGLDCTCASLVHRAAEMGEGFGDGMSITEPLGLDRKR